MNGLRRSSTINGKTTYYVYDGQTLVQEMQTNAQGQLQATATYLQGPRGTEGRVDETQQTEGYYAPGGTPANPSPLQARGRTRWYVYDGLGSVMGEVDQNGNLTASAKYDVYGAKRQGGTGTATSRQGFVGALGHVTDAETGLVYMRARYYDPNVGRFVSEDPGRHGKNWFSYCSDNPVNMVDPTGLAEEPDLINEIATALSEMPLSLDWLIDKMQVKPTEAAIAGISAAAKVINSAGGKFISQLKSLVGSGPADEETALEVEEVIEGAKAVGDAEQAVGLGARATEVSDENEEIT